MRPRTALLGILLAVIALPVYSQAPFRITDIPAANAAEKEELAAAIQEAQTSPQDTIRVLEVHLRKYPNTSMRKEIEKLLAEASMEAKDVKRTALYGIPALEMVPNDSHLLDRVSAALLEVGGKENAEKALNYAKRFEEYVNTIPVARGSDPVRNQEDHDRARARALLYQARANAVLGMNDDARRAATLAYMAYAEETSAKEWAKALERSGKLDEAVLRMADAFTVPDRRVTEETKLADRQQLGEMYRKLHNGSEAGLGDVILASYDRTAADVQKRRNELRKLDPNDGIQEASKFTLLGLTDDKLEMAKLRGKILILDFWATWCVPCRTQHPLYEEVKKRFEDRNDVMFVSVNSDDEHEVVEPFLEVQKWSREVYYDTGLSRLLSVNSIPATIVIDKDGNIASRMNGFVPDTFVDQLTSRIRAVLAGPVDLAR
jgi:thiol-disulfide isomerase/thioredoxin